MMGRRGWLGAMLAMTIPGLGGQTPQRPDQAYAGQQGAQVAPGSTNVVRARLVIISGPNSGEFLYSSNPPTSGTLVASAAPASTTTDPFGNTVVGGGFTSYGTGGAYAFLSIGELLLFASGAAAAAVLSAGPAGQATLTSGSVGGGDSTAGITLLSANANGGQRQVQLVGDQLQMPQVVVATASNLITFNDDITVNSANLNVGNGTSGNVNLNPKMATPPNEAAVGAGTATLAQTEAFAHGLYSSMKNRGMIN